MAETQSQQLEILAFRAPRNWLRGLAYVFGDLCPALLFSLIIEQINKLA